MADSEVRQKFQIVKQAELSYEVLLAGEHIEEFSDEPSASAYVRWFSAKLDEAYSAGMRAGEIAMKEKAAKRVEGNSCAQTCKYCQSDPCGAASADAIRALPLSGAEESTKEKA